MCHVRNTRDDFHYLKLQICKSIIDISISFLFTYSNSISYFVKLKCDTVFRNTSHCNFQILVQISFQNYNFISNNINQNDTFGITTNFTC